MVWEKDGEDELDRSYERIQRVKEERNFLHKLKRRKADWIGHTVCRDCLLKHAIEGNIEGTGRRGRRHKGLLNDYMKKRRYWKLKEDALDCAHRRTRFGRGYRRVVRQTA